MCNASIKTVYTVVFVSEENFFFKKGTKTVKINKVKQKTSLHQLNRASKFILLFDILPLFPHSEKMNI